MASPAFQRWAAGFPLTRRITRGNTRALFDLCAGFVYSQVLLACVRLELFHILARGPLPPEHLARSLDLPPQGAIRLLRAAASLGLVRVLRDGRYALADLGAALIGNPSVAAMIEHHAMLYADLADPVALLRGQAERTQLGAYWPYAGSGGDVGADSVAAYSRLMSDSQALIAEDVLDACSLSGHARLLDVGGGEGAFVIAAARRFPRLSLMLFDLPSVAERARARIGADGLRERISCHNGSFLADSLPKGADAISLIRVLHDHDDAPAQSILDRAYAALPAGGRLIVAEPMAGTPGAEPVGDAYFGFYLLAMGSGRPRHVRELTEMMDQAGFRRCREIPTRRPLLVRLITAVKPD